ncbi:MAG: hypothetical protein ABII25_02990 [bacterium]
MKKIPNEGNRLVEMVAASFSLRCCFAGFRRLKPAATTKDWPVTNEAFLVN